VVPYSIDNWHDDCLIHQDAVGLPIQAQTFGLVDAVRGQSA